MEKIVHIIENQYIIEFSTTLKYINCAPSEGYKPKAKEYLQSNTKDYFAFGENSRLYHRQKIATYEVAFRTTNVYIY